MTKKIFSFAERLAFYGALFTFIQIAYFLIKYHTVNTDLMTGVEEGFYTFFKWSFLTGIFIIAYMAKTIIVTLTERLVESKKNNTGLNETVRHYSQMIASQSKEIGELNNKIYGQHIEQSVLRVQLSQAEKLKENMKEIAVRWQEKQRDEKSKADYLEAALKSEQARVDQMIDKLLKEIIGGLQVTGGDIVMKPEKMSKKALKEIQKFMKQ